MPIFDTPGPISVTLELGVGDLRVVASDRADTVVEVQPSDPANPSDVTAAEKASVEYANGVLQIKAPKGWKRYGFRGGGESIDVHIELPAGSQLRGEAGVAALRSIGSLGECRYKTGAGDVTVEHVAGTAELTTGTGQVRIDRIGGSAMVKNTNGDTWIGEVVGDLQVKAANGKIAVDQAHGAVTAKTANGDIHLDEVARGVIVAETALGKVDVAVGVGVAAWLDLHTSFGQVNNLLDAGERPGPSEDTVEVRARSSFGDITIRRADIGDRGQGAA
jgi:Putative adhesin